MIELINVDGRGELSWKCLVDGGNKDLDVKRAKLKSGNINNSLEISFKDKRNKAIAGRCMGGWWVVFTVMGMSHAVASSLGQSPRSCFLTFTLASYNLSSNVC